MASSLISANKSVVEKGRSRIFRYSLNPGPAAPNFYFLPLDAFSCKGGELIKLHKVQANFNVRNVGYAMFVVYIYQGDASQGAGAIVVNQQSPIFNSTAPAGTKEPFIAYGWPLTSVDDSGNNYASGNANTEKIKAFCESGMTMVAGIATNTDAGAMDPSGIEYEIQRIDPIEY
jgi:hypothetical protein